VQDVSDRFWKHVARGPGCWDWQASKNPLGYGRFKLAGRVEWAHRVAYQLIVGPIHEGLVIDHLCRNPSCVRPSHLEPVTVQENVRRGMDARGGLNNNSRKTHCKRGHLLAGANLYPSTEGYRICRICEKLRWKAKAAGLGIDSYLAYRPARRQKAPAGQALPRRGVSSRHRSGPGNKPLAP
jgi:hypothetical protein